MGLWRKWTTGSWRHKVSLSVHLSPSHPSSLPLQVPYLRIFHNFFSFRSEAAPTAVSALSDKGVVYLAAGGSHCAAVTENGALYTWGRGSYGRLGHGKFMHAVRVVINVCFIFPWYRKC